MQKELPNTANQVIRIAELVSITGLSRSTIYEKQNPYSSRFDPLFPQRINLGARAVGWLKEEVEDWLELMINNSSLAREAKLSDPKLNLGA